MKRTSTYTYQLSQEGKIYLPKGFLSASISGGAYTITNENGVVSETITTDTIFTHIPDIGQQIITWVSGIVNITRVFIVDYNKINIFNTYAEFSSFGYTGELLRGFIISDELNQGSSSNYQNFNGINYYISQATV